MDRPGRHFLQIPGPTNLPDRVLRAMDRPLPDHRGPEMPGLVAEVREGLRKVFQTQTGEVLLFPGSGTGAWEASVVNTLEPGDRVLAFDIGQFSRLYAECAARFGAEVDLVPRRWGTGVPAEVVYDRLRADRAHAYRAVLVVHNETSTGVTSDVAAVRQAMDASDHPALLLVDVVSSLGSIDFRFDEWRVDVAVCGTQKGLMLPPGMAVLCVSPRAVERSRAVRSARYFFDWGPMLEENRRGYFPYTPATLLLYGLREALRMLLEEGLPNVFTRHARLAEGVRQAVRAWGLRILCEDPREYSNSLTAVVVPEGYDAHAVLQVAEERLHLSLGTGLGPLRGRVFRIGHLGWLNELEVLATVAGVELAMHLAGIPVPLGEGVSSLPAVLRRPAGPPPRGNSCLLDHSKVGARFFSAPRSHRPSGPACPTAADWLRPGADVPPARSWHNSLEVRGMAIELDLLRPVTDEELLRLSERNPGYQFERTADGRLVVSPTGSKSGWRSLKVAYQLERWNERTGLGVVFDSSAGFHLPDGSLLSPDASWVARERWGGAHPARAGRVRAPVPGRRLRDPVARAGPGRVAAQNGGLPAERREDRRAARPPTPAPWRCTAPASSPQRLEAPDRVALDPELPGFALDPGPVFEA
jgi:alanine-glyoxylate transaminase/serine-glyoxylate transaminase/serine-pyruvate transaminase